jgi:hypothetical protein
MESFECRGVWTVPGFEQFSGILKFNPVDGVVLETIGIGKFAYTISELTDDSPHTRTRNPNFIWGHTDHHVPVTLYKCTLNHRNDSFSVETAFVGHRFEKEKEIVFESLSLEYSNLAEWVGISGFDGGIKSDKEHKIALGAEAKYEPPKKSEYRINDFVMSLHYDWSVGGDWLTNVRMNQTTLIGIKPDTPLSYEDYRTKILTPLRQFLTLAMGQTVHTKAIRGNNTVTIFHYLPESGIPKKTLQNRDILFTFHHIKDDFETYLQKWFALREKLQPVLDLYFGLFDIPSMYPNTQFLTLAQALESYHRHLYDRNYMDDAANFDIVKNILIDAIPDNVEDNHRKSLSRTLEFGNEFSLTKRLKLILNVCLEDYDEIVTELFGSRKKRKGFVGRVVKHRNYLTHYSNKEDAITDPKELRRYIQKMMSIIQLCFLKELGIPAETAKTIVKHKRWF